MAWSGGTFTRIDGATGWQDDEAAGTGIEAGLMDTAFNDLAADGINQTLNKAGQNTPTANLPMGGYKHTGVANASSNDEYTTQGQLTDNSFTAELEALEVAPTSANTAIDVTAKSGASGNLANLKDNAGNSLFRVENSGWAAINSDSTRILGAATAFEIRPVGSTGNSYTANFSTIGNDESVVFDGITNVGGSIRQGLIGVGKHSGITYGCGYVMLEAESGTNYHMWNDNSGIFRSSNTFAHIGTTSGVVIGTQTSDERLKEIEPDFGYGLEQVKALKPIAYVRKDDPDQKRRIGFGAQTTKSIVPEAVYDTKEEIEGEDPAETKLAMDYTSIIPVLVKAIQELEAKVASLEAQVAGT